MQQDKKVYMVLLYIKDPDYRSRLSQLIVHERRHGSYKDLFAATDFIFCKSIAKIKYSSLYQYSITIDWTNESRSLSVLNENAEGFPGQDTSYKHFTYIRIIDVTNDLWMFLRKVPLTLGDGKVLSVLPVLVQH